MDVQRFDGFSRALAGRLSRRTVLRRAGQGGLAAALVAGFGGKDAAAHTGNLAAQGQDLTEALDGVCLLPFEITVRQGPNEGQEYVGALALKVAADGAIDEGFFATVDGDGFAVVGQATGRAVSLLITFADGQYLYGVGAAEQAVAACAGEMGGPLVGPERGDLGDWAVVDVAAQAAGRRSQICKGCLQSCRNCFGFCIDPPDAGACRQACLDFGSCGPGDFG